MKYQCEKCGNNISLFDWNHSRTCFHCSKQKCVDQNKIVEKIKCLKHKKRFSYL